MILLCALLLLSGFTYELEAGPPPPHLRVGPFDKSDDGVESPETPDVSLKGNLYEGDIVDAYLSQEVGRAGRAQPPWPNAIIPYRFDCSVVNSPSIINSVKAAMLEWESKTCLRFVEKTSQHTSYVEFIKSSGCWASHVGYRKNTKTKVSVGRGCDYKHVMVHELGHVIGFWHEQSRKDRDNYITIDFTNVLPALAYNFNKVGEVTESFGQAYDYGSIMHYPWNAFALDARRRTIKPKKNTRLTPYVKLSDVDAEQTKRMYKCSSIKVGRAESRQNMSKKVKVLGTAKSLDNDCMDMTSDCKEWARDGHCSTTPDPMLIICKKSCSNCGPCVDKHKNCDAWAHYGFCVRHPTYMLKNCKSSCAICKRTPTTSAPVTTEPTTKPPTTETPNKYGITKPKKRYLGVKCADRSTTCGEWKKEGRCRTDGWVKNNCMLSCERYDICDIEQIKPIGKCTSSLGLGWDESLPDDAFYSTSTFRPGSGWTAPASAGRLYRTDDQMKLTIGSWCATVGQKNQYLQVDLRETKRVTALATQGRSNFFEHVTTYYLTYSYNNRDWLDVKAKGTNDKQVFDGNCDNFTPVINILHTPIIARFVRIHPVQYRGAACVRLELYGCDY